MPCANLTERCSVDGRKPECTDPMCPALVFGFGYDAIKQRLMDRHWPWGSRLELEEIAEMGSIGRTPAREILQRLVGEKMVSFALGRGFSVPKMNEHKLRDLLEHRQKEILTAINLSKNSSAILGDGADMYQVSKIFLQLGIRSGNDSLVETISGLNDRLHQFRRCDSQFFNDVNSELEDMKAAANDDPKGAKLRHLVIRYHVRRIAKASEYIRLMTSNSD